MKQTVQDLMTEIETIKKTQTKGILDTESLIKGMGATEASITNRIQEMEERILDVEDTIEVVSHLSKKRVSPKNS